MPEKNAPAADVATKPPLTAKDGTAMNGLYPLNNRLRAEALANEGKTEDPDGIIEPDVIASTGERLEREAKAAKDAEDAAAAEQAEAEKAAEAQRIADEKATAAAEKLHQRHEKAAENAEGAAGNTAAEEN